MPSQPSSVSAHNAEQKYINTAIQNSSNGDCEQLRSLIEQCKPRLEASKGDLEPQAPAMNFNRKTAKGLTMKVPGFEDTALKKNNQ